MYRFNMENAIDPSKMQMRRTLRVCGAFASGAVPVEDADVGGVWGVGCGRSTLGQI